MLPATTDRPTSDGPERPPRWWRYERVRRPAGGPAKAEVAPGSTRRSHPLWEAATPGERAVAVGAVLLMVVYGPRLAVGQWVVENAAAVAIGLAGVPLLVASMLPSAGRTRRERVAATLLVAWLLIGLAAALHSSRPVLSIVGTYNLSEGWLFFAALGGFWAFGTSLRATGRALIGTALIVGAVANSVVAILQIVVGLSRFDLPLYNASQATGFQGNPVFLGGIAAAAAVLVLVRTLERGAGRRDLAALAVLGAGAGISAERMSALVVLVAAGATAVAAWRRRRRAAAPPTGTGSGRPGRSAGVRGAVGAAISSVAGFAVGALLPTLRGVTGVAGKLSTSAEGTFGDRLHAWLEGLRAVVHAPLLGAGPGRFEAATSALFPLWFERSHPGQVFGDAHDLFVEVAVTTGILGLAALMAWVVAAARHCRGPLLAFAAAALAVELVEPLNPVLTPLLFLALGSAGAGALGAAGAGAVDERAWTGPIGVAARCEAVRPGPAGVAAPGPGRGDAVTHRVPRTVTVATVVAGIVGILLAADVVVGSRLMVDATGAVTTNQTTAHADAALADHLLAPWPQSAETMAMVAILGQSEPGGPTPLAQAVHWEQTAAARDPADSPAWADAAQDQLRVGDLKLAAADAHQALRSLPWEPGALTVLGDVALDRGDRAAARGWFSRLVEVQPRPPLSVLLRGACARPAAVAVPSATQHGCA